MLNSNGERKRKLHTKERMCCWARVMQCISWLEMLEEIGTNSFKLILEWPKQRHVLVLELTHKTVEEKACSPPWCVWARAQ